MRQKSEEKMRRIVALIEEKYFATGLSPSLSEIGLHVGLSKGMVSQYLAEMEERGMLTRGEGYYSVRTTRMQRMKNDAVHLPVVGRIACGAPLLAEEHIEQYVTISSSLLGAGEHFVLRAKGESMIGAGISDGDAVIVRRQTHAEEGQIVVALLEDEATLKRFFIDRESGRIRLHPENPTMEDIFADTVAIQGVAVKVLRDLV